MTAISYGYSKSGRKSYFVIPTGAATELYADLWFTDVEVKATEALYRRITKSSKASAIAMVLSETGNLGINSEYADEMTPSNLLVNLYEGKESGGQMVVGGEVDPNPPDVYRDAKGNFFVRSSLLLPGFCRVVTANHKLSFRTDKCGIISFSEPTKKANVGWALDGSSVKLEDSYHLDDATEGNPICKRMYNASGDEYFKIYVPK